MKDLQDKITDLILVLFGLFIAYQLLRAILGGSWQSEAFIAALLIFNIGVSWKTAIKLERHFGWHKGRNSK